MSRLPSPDRVMTSPAGLANESMSGIGMGRGKAPADNVRIPWRRQRSCSARDIGRTASTRRARSCSSCAFAGISSNVATIGALPPALTATMVATIPKVCTTSGGCVDHLSRNSMAPAVNDVSMSLLGIAHTSSITTAPAVRRPSATWVTALRGRWETWVSGREMRWTSIEDPR